jgi:subtilisin family serine protease
VDALVHQYGGTVLHYYPETLFGFAIRIDSHLAPLLALDPRVDYVEQDQWLHAATSQSSPPWGLDRIDQPSLPINGVYNYPSSGGVGVTLYILDSGVNESPDLTGRLTMSINFVSAGGKTDLTAFQDLYGHGTHVAGIAAGTNYGVAKRASVVNLRVLDGNGKVQNSDALAGVDWLKKNAVRPAIANMSLIADGGKSDALDKAIQSAISSGITVVISAGNYSGDACSYAPADVPEAIVVGSVDKHDKLEYDSNTGSCVSLLAPGMGIESYWLTIVAPFSGTSFAAPHVAGAAALYLADHTTASPAEVKAALLERATTLNTMSATTPNKLLLAPGP